MKSFLILCVSMCLSNQIVAEEKLKKGTLSDKVNVSGDKVSFVGSDVVATGNVVVNYKNVSVTCNKVTVNIETKHLDAEGKVIIQKINGNNSNSEDAKALAGKVVGNLKTGNFTLSGNAELRRGKDVTKGKVIKYSLGSGKMKVIGKSKLQLNTNPQ